MCHPPPPVPIPPLYEGIVDPHLRRAASWHVHPQDQGDHEENHREGQAYAWGLSVMPPCDAWGLSVMPPCYAWGLSIMHGAFLSFLSCHQVVLFTKSGLGNWTFCWIFEVKWLTIVGKTETPLEVQGALQLTRVGTIMTVDIFPILVPFGFHSTGSQAHCPPHRSVHSPLHHCKGVHWIATLCFSFSRFISSHHHPQMSHGTLEAHANGLRFVSQRNEKVEILYTVGGGNPIDPVWT